MTHLDLHDTTTIRELAKQVSEAAARPEMAERRRRWMAHNSLRSKEPMMLVFPEGAWEELLPDAALVCREADARAIEWELRRRLYTFCHFQDDTVVEAEWVEGAWKNPWEIQTTGWGMEPVTIPSSEARGAYRIQPVMEGPRDIKKLRYPDLVYDPRDHGRRLEQMHDLLGDILTVRRKGVAQIAYHLWSQYLSLRGESACMMDMIDAPEMIHEVMGFFEDGHFRLLGQMIERNLLSLNNDGTYHASGGNGYTDDLPAADFDPGHVRPCDMWASAESQELAGVSPRMHRTFALQYERRLLAPFGLTGYGCCEDLTRKIEDVMEVPNIRRVSISPFADVDQSAAKLKDKAIFSWKPQPAHLAGEFQPEVVRGYVRHTLDVCKENGCVLEVILKDTHTCENHPERFDQWTKIAREEIDKIASPPTVGYGAV